MRALSRRSCSARSGPSWSAPSGGRRPPSASSGSRRSAKQRWAQSKQSPSMLHIFVIVSSPCVLCFVYGNLFKHHRKCSVTVYSVPISAFPRRSRAAAFARCSPATRRTQRACGYARACCAQARKGGHDTVGNPHRAQIYQFELFELVLLLKLDKGFPVEEFEATVSRSTAPSPPLLQAPSAGASAGSGCS